MNDREYPKGTVTSLPDQVKKREEAGAWLVRLDRGLDANEQDALKSWLASSEEHRRYLHQLASTWDDMGVLVTLREIFPLLPAGKPGSAKEKNLASGYRWGWSIGSTIAVSMALVILAVGTLLLSRPESSALETRQALATVVGQQFSHVLPDGSRVVLNTRSSVEVHFNDLSRTVRMYAGEVSFDVVHDADRPFIVYAGNGLVSTLGTAFTVRIQSGVVDVIVTEGRVGVISTIAEDPPAAELMTPERFEGNGRARALISAGHRARFEDEIESIEALDMETLARRQAWKQGALIFKGEPLEDVLAEVSRYTDQRLVITDSSISRMRVGGHFRISDISSLLALLADNFDLEITKVDSDLIHLAARKSRSPVDDGGQAIPATKRK